MIKNKIDTIFDMLETGHYSEQDAKDKLLDLYNANKSFYCYSEESNCGRCDKVCDDCKK